MGDATLCQQRIDATNETDGTDVLSLNARWRTVGGALNSLPMSNSTPKAAISPRRDEDFPEWYQQVIRAAELGSRRTCAVAWSFVRGATGFGTTCNVSWTR